MSKNNELKYLHKMPKKQNSSIDNIDYIEIQKFLDSMPNINTVLEFGTGLSTYA